MGKRPHLAPLGLTCVENAPDVGAGSWFSAIFPFVWPTGVKNRLEFWRLRLKRSRMYVVSFWVMGWRASLKNAFALALKIYVKKCDLVKRHCTIGQEVPWVPEIFLSRVTRSFVVVVGRGPTRLRPSAESTSNEKPVAPKDPKGRYFSFVPSHEYPRAST